MFHSKFELVFYDFNFFLLLILKCVDLRPKSSVCLNISFLIWYKLNTINVIIFRCQNKPKVFIIFAILNGTPKTRLVRVVKKLHTMSTESARAPLPPRAIRHNYTQLLLKTKLFGFIYWLPWETRLLKLKSNLSFFA